MAFVFIGLGSNIGDRGRYLASAVRMVKEIISPDMLAESSILETKAVDFTEQPDFLNQVILIKTEIPPEKLLEMLKEIENTLGRVRRFTKGPREIDLDILLYDDVVMNSDVLIIPHPEILNRDFILENLIELNPELRDPRTGEKYSLLHNQKKEKVKDLPQS